MAFVRRLLALLALVVVLAAAPKAESAPMYTDFATIRARAQLIVLGKVTQTLGPNNTSVLAVDVDTVIRGTAARGPMAVQESPDGHVMVTANERVVAFIDNGALRWVGTLAAGASLETGVIHLQGFFDFNAHIVQPGILTLAELKKALATGQLDQNFDVTLAFRDGHGGFARSTRTLGVQYSPFTRSLHVTGSTPACLTPGALFGLDWKSFELRFHDNCPSSTPSAASRSRSLDLDGKFTGVDQATGHIQVEAVPTRPLLTEAEYATFAADGAIAEMTSVIGIALSDGTSWTWRLEKDLVDPGGKVHAAGGVSISSSMQNGKTVSRDDYDFEGGVKITLTPGAGTGSPGGNAHGVVTLVDSRAPLGCTFAQSGHPDRSCTLSVRPPIVVRR